MTKVRSVSLSDARIVVLRSDAEMISMSLGIAALSFGSAALI